MEEMIKKDIVNTTSWANTTVVKERPMENEGEMLCLNINLKE